MSIKRALAGMVLVVVATMGSASAMSVPGLPPGAKLINRTEARGMVTFEYQCGNVIYLIECYDCKCQTCGVGAEETGADGVSRYCVLAGIKSTGGSFIENIYANHHHTALDYAPGDPSAVGCASCGAGGGRGSLAQLKLERRHRYREAYRFGSFGAGVFGCYDIRLELHPSNANTITYFNPTLSWPKKFVDGINGDTVVDGIYTDQLNKAFKEVRLYDAAGTLVKGVAAGGPAGYTYCANENGSYALTGTCDVAYGANGKFNYKYAQTGTLTFNNASFGDPCPGVVKKGYYKVTGSPDVPPSGGLNLAKTAVLETHTGAKTYFEIVALGSDTLVGRVTRIEDRNGYATVITYKSFTAEEIALSPERQLQIEKVTDAYGRSMTFTYLATQVSGNWVVSGVTLPNGSLVSYQYADGKLSQVLYPDGTQSSFNYGFDTVSSCATVYYDDAGASGEHRRKTAYLTSNFGITNATAETAEVVTQASLLAKLLVNGSDEVTYLRVNNPTHVSLNEHFIYEGGAKARLLHACWTDKYYKDGWTVTNPALGFAGIAGSLESTYDSTPVDHAACHQGTWQTSTDAQGNAYRYTYDGQGFRTGKSYSDGTSEDWTYNSSKQVVRYRDRLNRVTLSSYDTRGNILTREVGLLCVNVAAKTDVAQPEYAIYRWEYYPAGHAQQYLLKTAFDALSLGATDPMHRTDYEYNEQHQVAKVTQGADSLTAERGFTLYEYYPDTLALKKVTDPVGRIVEYAYDTRERCKEITYATYPAASTEKFFYGTGVDANLLVKKKDRTDVTTKFEYDSAGRKVKTVAAYSRMANGDPLQESEIQDANLRSEEVCTYVNGTTLKASCTRDGKTTEYTYDYRHRVMGTTVYPKGDTALASSNTYVNNLLFCSADAYGRKTYYAYRTADSATIRTVRGLVPSFTLANFAAVIALTRSGGPNPDYVIEDYALDFEGQRLATTDANGVVHKTEYDSRGQVRTQVAAYGAPDDPEDSERKSPAAQTKFEYDKQGNRVKVSGPRSYAVNGAGTTFTPGANGEYATLSAYNGRNLVASVTRAVGRAEATPESYTYYKDGRIADTIDGRGNVWTTKWRKCCPVVVGQIEPPATSSETQRATRISGTDYENRPTYAAVVKNPPTTQDLWRNPADEDTLNEVTTKLDELGRPVARCVWLKPLSVANAWVNPPIAGENGVPAGDGLTTKWTYDRSAKDTSGLSGEAQYRPYFADLSWDANADGNAVLVTEPGGEKTLVIMDGLGRTVRTVRINGDQTTSIVVDTVYDGTATVDGKVLVEARTIRYPNGFVAGGAKIETTSCADGAGLTRQSLDAELRATKMWYDPNGNLLKLRDPNEVGFDAKFDALNRETKRFDTLQAAESDGVPVPVRVAYRLYDAHSNVVKTRDALSTATVFEYDGLDRRVKTTDRIAGETTFTFDRNSNLLEIKDADAAAKNQAQPTTVYRYDARNLLVIEAYRDDATEANYSTNEADLNQFDADDRRSYSYDAARRLTKRTDQLSVQTGYAYDMVNRLLTRSYPDSQNDYFRYDSDSRLTRAASLRYGNLVLRAYDNAGRLSNETQHMGGTLTITDGDITVTGGTPYSLSYGFDGANRKTSEGYPNGQSVARAYTDRDQLASVSFGGSAVVSSFMYDIGGREISRVLANNVTQARTWRGDNLPATIASSAVNLSYSWDANKRKTAEADGLHPSLSNTYGLSGGTTNGYDDEDRLTHWWRGNANDIRDWQDWGLSKVGDWNQFTKNGATETREHNAVHEILTATPPNPAAQLVHDAKGNLTTNKNGQTYLWDVENRLAKATQGETTLGDYAYDALGRRVSKTVNDVTTTYINNASWQEVAEYQGANLVQRYVYGSYIDEVLCMVKADNSRYFYSTNDLYSVYALTDGTGNVVERYMYDPYGKVTVLDKDGNPIAGNVSAVGNPFLWQGGRLDTETGLYPKRQRYYDPALGRFISRWVEPDADQSLYEFQFDLPTFYLDPFGDPGWGDMATAVPPPGPSPVRPPTTVGFPSKGANFPTSPLPKDLKVPSTWPPGSSGETTGSPARGPMAISGGVALADLLLRVARPDYGGVEKQLGFSPSNVQGVAYVQLRDYWLKRGEIENSGKSGGGKGQGQKPRPITDDDVKRWNEREDGMKQSRQVDADNKKSGGCGGYCVCKIRENDWPRDDSEKRPTFDHFLVEQKCPKFVVTNPVADKSECNKAAQEKLDEWGQGHCKRFLGHCEFIGDQR